MVAASTNSGVRFALEPITRSRAKEEYSDSALACLREAVRSTFTPFAQAGTMSRALERYDDIRASSRIVNGQLMLFVTDFTQTALDPLYGHIALFCRDPDSGCDVHALCQPVPTSARV